MLELRLYHRLPKVMQHPNGGGGEWITVSSVQPVEHIVSKSLGEKSDD